MSVMFIVAFVRAQMRLRLTSTLRKQSANGRQNGSNRLPLQVCFAKAWFPAFFLKANWLTAFFRKSLRSQELEWTS